MTSSDSDNFMEQITVFLKREGFVVNSAKVSFSPLAGDGSSRLFFKISTGGDETYCGVLPGREDRKKAMAEAHAAYNIGTHLQKRGIPVPTIHAYNPENGFILFEDLGDTLLYDRLEAERQKDGAKLWAKYTATYKEIIEMLLYMQISGSVRFDRKWCWDTQRYDKKIMLEKESAYFLQAFCRDLLGIKNFPAPLSDEFNKLATKASRQPAVYFLHRDFQSRNLMIRNDEIRVIDFQGGRLGPLGYDLASLLIDPYARIPDAVQQELLDHYLEHLCKYGLDDRAFLKGYPSLALQRNLQILGAFAFLSNRKNKTFFKQFIKPATLSLQQLAGREKKDYPHLVTLTEKILARIATQE